jgi:hypothetical protein
MVIAPPTIILEAPSDEIVQGSSSIDPSDVKEITPDTNTTL